MLRWTTARSLPAIHRPSRTPSLSSECRILPTSNATRFFSFVITSMPLPFADEERGDGRYRTGTRDTTRLPLRVPVQSSRLVH